MKYRLCLFSALLACAPGMLLADCLQRAHEFADQVCGSIQTRGYSDILDAEGKLTVEAGDWIRRFAGQLGGSVSVGKTIDAYENVLRKDLAGELRDLRKCRVRMVEVAMAQVCPAAEASQNSAQPAASKWVTTGRTDDRWQGWGNIDSSRRLRPPRGGNYPPWIHAMPCGESRLSTDAGARDYCIHITGRNVLHPADAPYGAATDARVQVTLRALQTPPTGRNAAGLIFGRSHGKEYRFTIRSDGSWLLDKDTGAETGKVLLGWTPIVNYDNDKPHRLAVTAEDGHLHLYLDSVLIADLLESGYRGGSAGIFVYSDDAAVADFAFTDFQFDRKTAP